MSYRIMYILGLKVQQEKKQVSLNIWQYENWVWTFVWKHRFKACLLGLSKKPCVDVLILVKEEIELNHKEKKKLLV